MSSRRLSFPPEYLPFGKPHFSEREETAILRVIRSGWIGMGPEVLAFEAELANYLQIPHVVTVNSCTSALFLALLVSGIKAGDEVICPSLTWCATANVARHLGAQVVFADVDPDTLCLDPDAVKARISPRTRAVMPVHFGGYPADMGALRAVLPSDVAIIEDAAHAFGARFADGRLVGASGNFTCFSFYANKNLSTGEGGAIALFDDAVADRLRSLRQNGMPVNAWNRFQQARSLLYHPLEELGYKMNYTDLQAAIGRVQLARFTDLQARRRAVAECYEEALSRLDPPARLQRGITLEAHARHLFALRLNLDCLDLDRDAFVLELREAKIGASIHYCPLHTMPLYRQADVVLPITEAIGREILSLPISASLDLDAARYIAETFVSLYQKHLHLQSRPS